MTRRALRLVSAEPDDPRDDTRAWHDVPVPELVDRLYSKHAAMVYHLALRYGGGDATWAEDITQDVFLRLFDHVHAVLEADNPAGWFYRVTTNRCLTRLRRERFLDAAPVRTLLRRRARRVPDPEHIGIVRDDLAHAFRVVSRASPKARVCFFMYHVDGKSLDEIGQLLGHSKGWVCKLIKRIEAEIRRQEAGGA